MTTLLDAARQALPGLEWAKMASQVCAKVHDRWAGMCLAHDGQNRVWLGDLLEHHATAAESAQWLRAQVTARRDALDAALGEKHLGTSAREAWAPVTERLPEPYHMAIVYSKGRILVLQKWPQLWSGDDEIAGSVTHWRPIPAPPKGEP